MNKPVAFGPSVSAKPTDESQRRDETENIEEEETMIIINENVKQIVKDFDGVEAITYLNNGKIDLIEVREGEKIGVNETTVTGEFWQIMTHSIVELHFSHGVKRYPVQIGW